MIEFICGMIVMGVAVFVWLAALGPAIQDQLEDWIGTLAGREALHRVSIHEAHLHTVGILDDVTSLKARVSKLEEMCNVSNTGSTN